MARTVLVCRAVADHAAAHNAHVAAGHAAVAFVGCVAIGAAARRHVVAVYIVGKLGVQLFLRVHLAGLGKVGTETAVHADVIDPCVPGVCIDAGKRTRHARLTLRGIDRRQRRGQRVNLDQAEQQAQAACIGRIGRTHDAGVATRDLGAEH